MKVSSAELARVFGFMRRVAQLRALEHACGGAAVRLPQSQEVVAGARTKPHAPRLRRRRSGIGPASTAVSALSGRMGESTSRQKAEVRWAQRLTIAPASRCAPGWSTQGLCPKW